MAEAGGRGLLDLMIARIPGIRSGDRMVLCGKFDDEGDFTRLSVREVDRICAEGRGEAAYGRLFNDEAERWSMKSIMEQAEKDAAFMGRHGISWVSAAMSAYPQLLREIYDPPAVLFYRGTLPPPEKLAVAVVGTRKPRPAALRWTYDTARDLALAGVTVVSGLALGIDAMAHRGCVDAISGGYGGVDEVKAAPTLAVLGSSVDEVYPATNRALARRIVADGGALLSEYPPGTRPAKWNFPARNRIISGLCRCTVVVEAGKKSGALITAGFALEHGRDLYVAQGGGDVFGEGCERLNTEGAARVRGAEDILAELGGL
ncbi:MAG: DNA-processing protein DprA [Spirochaetaceae bacterium]|jgi:DNA processing protein|nr:DNA-processing protein DprA [Spirochaetaceae bacterium]